MLQASVITAQGLWVAVICGLGVATAMWAGAPSAMAREWFPSYHELQLPCTSYNVTLQSACLRPIQRCFCCLRLHFGVCQRQWSQAAAFHRG